VSHARLPERCDPLIAGLDVRDLLRQFGSPLFILDAQRLDRQAAVLTSVFRPPRYRLYYAVKANPRVAVVRRLAWHGFGCDATGIGDMEVALAAGCSPSAISVTGVGFSAPELEYLVSRGLCPNLDSIDELRLFCELRPGGTVGLRVNPGVAAGFHPHVVAGARGGKLGIDLDDLPEAITVARDARVTIRTLHTHLGSLLYESEPFVAAFAVLLQLAAEFPSVTTLNLGGGFGIPYVAGTPEFPFALLERELRGRVDAFEDATGRTLTVALEPGEFLVGPAGYLAATVRVTKPSSRIAIVDASTNLLPAVLLYGEPYDAAVLPVCAREGAEKEWSVCGRTNQGGETLAAGMTRPLQRGDIVLFSMVGAYTSCRASQFNQIPRPAEVMLDRGHAQLARAAEDYSQVLRLADDTGTMTPLRSAGTVRLDTEAHSPGRVDYGYSVDGESHSLSVAFSDPETRLDERERAVVAGAVGVLLAQLVLAERLDFAVPLPRGLVQALRPCIKVLYDVRCYCDGRPLVALPRMQGGADEVEPVQADRAHRDGTLVAISGGFDSTLLLHLASRCGERVEAVHFRVNESVRDEEERAAKAIAAACGVPLHIVNIENPGLVELGRRYSSSFGRFPHYNTVPHGRDLLLIPLAAILARRLGLGRVSFGFEREALLERMEYRGATIHRNDFASEHGFDLVSGLLRTHLDPDIVLEAPLWSLSGYRIRRTVLGHLPELAAEIQTCYWERWCERCSKCVTTSLLEADLGRKLYQFQTDMLDDPHNDYLGSLLDADNDSAHLPSWDLALHTLDGLERVGHEKLWVRRFSESFRASRQEDIATARGLCEAVERQALVERFGHSVNGLIDSY
jgi:diaminopimelate decarboxylase